MIIKELEKKKTGIEQMTLGINGLDREILNT